MQYEMDRLDGEKFTITLTVESREEFINMHDNVMGKITGESSHKFHGDLYLIGNGEVDGVSGEILREKQGSSLTLGGVGPTAAEATEALRAMGDAVNSKPSTKAEYVKVTGSIFDLKDDFESGLLSSDDCGDYVVTCELQLAELLYDSTESLYRKVETEITWQDELKDKYPTIDFNRLDDGGGCDLGSWSTKEFIEMCHLVASLTK
jgi:hypothetical protein